MAQSYSKYPYLSEFFPYQRSPKKRRFLPRLYLKRNLKTDILLRDLKHSQNIDRSISTTLGNWPWFQFIKLKPSTKNWQIMQGQSLQCHFFISNLNKSNDKNSKVGQLWSYCISAVFFGFRIWQKSYSTTSKVILKESFCKNFFHYGSWKTVRDIFRIQSSIFKYFLYE